MSLKLKNPPHPAAPRTAPAEVRLLLSTKWLPGASPRCPIQEHSPPSHFPPDSLCVDRCASSLAASCLACTPLPPAAISPLKRSSFTALPVFSFHSHSPHFRKTTERSPVPGKRRSPLEGSTSAPCPSQHVCLPLPPTPLPWWVLPALPPGTSFGTERVPGSLTAQKPLDRPGWWKGESAVIQMPATGGGGQMSIQGPTPLPPATSGARAFRDRSGRGGEGVRGLHAETRSQL